MPASLDLGDGDCGGTASTTFQLANPGGSELRFEFAPSDPRLAVAPRAGVLAAGQTLAVRVTAEVPAEVDAGERLVGSIVAKTNAGMKRAIEVALRTRGAQLVIEPASIGFGQTAVGFPSARPFSVRNVGNLAAAVTVAAPGGEFGHRFGGGGGTVVLAPGQAAGGEVSYLPVNLGPDAATAAVAVAGPVCGAAPRELALAGAGGAGPGVMVQGGPIDFGVVGCDAGGQTRTITLVNPAAIDAPFTARFPDDVEFDDLRFAVSPEIGVVPAHGSIELVVRRNPLSAPAEARVHAAVLQITTTLGADAVAEIPVRDDVRSPYLVAAAERRDFGFLQAGEAQMLPITVTNSGTVTAALAAVGPFQVLLPMPLAPGATGTAWVVYRPQGAPAPVSGNVVLSARSSCQAPVALPFQGGTGPYAVVHQSRLALRGGCLRPSRTSVALVVENRGNRQLEIRCRETIPSELALQISPDVLSVPAGAARAFAVSMETPPGEAGEVGSISTGVDCFDNEPLISVRSTLVTREYVLDDAEPCITE